MYGMKNVIGAKVREARNRAPRRISQDELASKLQTMGLTIDRSAISKIEIGIRPITDIEILGICEALGIKVTDLFTKDIRLPSSK